MFEEEDEDDQIGRAVVYRPSKKKSKQEKKKEVECINLSSDEETEEDDSLVEIVDDDNNHYFGEDVVDMDGDPLAGTLEIGSDEPLAFNVIYIWLTLIDFTAHLHGLIRSNYEARDWSWVF